MNGRRGGAAGIGFSLFGILAVVVVLGVAAAIAVPSLSGNKSGGSSTTTTVVDGTHAGTKPDASATTTEPTTGIPSQAAAEACEADAQTVATAVQDYEDLHGGSASAVTPAVLTSGSTPFLQSFPSSPDYAISIVNGVVMIAAPKTALAVPYNTAGACVRAGP